jgi:hypothetical protein
VEGIVESQRSASEIGQRVPQREKQEDRAADDRQPSAGPTSRGTAYSMDRGPWGAPAQAAADVRLTARPASIKPRGVCPAEPEKIRSVAANALAMDGANPNRPTFK